MLVGLFVDLTTVYQLQSLFIVEWYWRTIFNSWRDRSGRDNFRSLPWHSWSWEKPRESQSEYI